jgi:hypothetical protein
MGSSPLDIFKQGTTQAPDATVRRGVGAVLGLATLIAGIVLLLSTVVIVVVGGVAEVLLSPSQVDVVAFTQLGCQRTTHDVVVSATIARGPDFDTDFGVALAGWNPEDVPFETGRPVDGPSLAPGDRVSFSAPTEHVDEITGVRMTVWRGEPGYAQIVPLVVRLEADGCTASVSG